MPKIPTYDQLGQRVKAPTTQLGLKADTQAFVGAQLATADLFKKAGDMAYQFGMKEKAENTKAAFNEIKAQYNNEVNDFIRNDDSTSTTEAETKLKDFNIKFEKNYARKGLTPNQIKSIKTDMILHQGNKMQVGKNLAFDRGRDYNSDLHNKSLVNLEMEISKLPQGNPLRKYMMDEALEIYQTAAENGETGNLTIKSFADFEKKIKLIDYSLLSTNAKTIEDLSKLKSSVDNETLLHSDKVNILNDIKVNETRVLSEYVEALSMKVFEGKKEEFLNDEYFEKSLQKLLKLEKIETVNAKGQAITIDLRKLSSNQLRTIKNLATNKKNELEAEELNDLRNAEIKSAQTMTLSQIVERKKAIDNGTYRPDIKNFAARQAMKSIYGDVESKRQTEDLATANKNKKNIKAAIFANDGLIDEVTSDKIKETNKIYGLTENIDAKNEFDLDIQSAVKSNSLFKLTQFSSITDQRKSENDALQDFKSEEDINKKALKLKIYTDLLNRNSKERALFVKNPVGYLEKNLGTLTPEQRISKQETMGVMSKDIRIASNAELEEFRSSFSNETTFAGKSNVAEQFFNKFGEENSNLVMKNLVTNNVITKVESLMLSDPENINMEFITIANSTADVDRFKSGNQKLKTAEMKTLMSDVYGQLEKYSNSIIGKAYSGENDAGLNQSANNHLKDTAEIVKNTALKLIIDGKMGHSAAVKKAYTMALGESHEFIEINNKYIRVEKNSGLNTEGVKGVLNFIIQDKESLLKNIISAEKAGVQTDVTNEKYVDRIGSDGGWRTTVDNQSVYLIDGTGNMVRRKSIAQPSDVGGVSSLIDQTSPFVIIKLDALNAIAKQVVDIEDDIGPMGSGLLVKGQATEEFLKTRTKF